jgi:hypothetical protein
MSALILRTCAGAVQASMLTIQPSIDDVITRNEAGWSLAGGNCSTLSKERSP